MEGKSVFRKLSFDLDKEDKKEKEISERLPFSLGAEDIDGGFFTKPAASPFYSDVEFFRRLSNALKIKEGGISKFYEIWGEEIAQQCRSSFDMGAKAEELRKRICKLKGLEGNLLEIAQEHQPENERFHELLRVYSRGSEDIVFEKEEVAVFGAGAGRSPAPRAASGLSALFGRPKANSV